MAPKPKALRLKGPGTVVSVSVGGYMYLLETPIKLGPHDTIFIDVHNCKRFPRVLVLRGPVKIEGVVQ